MLSLGVSILLPVPHRIPQVLKLMRPLDREGTCELSHRWAILIRMRVGAYPMKSANLTASMHKWKRVKGFRFITDLMSITSTLTALLKRRTTIRWMFVQVFWMAWMKLIDSSPDA